VREILFAGVSEAVFWLMLFLILAVIEAASFELITIWFAIGALFGFFGALAGFSFLWQVILFVFTATIFLIYTRPLAVKYLNTGTKRTNVDRFLGEQGIVIEAIDAVNGKGQVRVLGQVWSARTLNGEPIDVDTKIEVLEISGVKLIVQKVAP
jgi:membrane protein implicated in regulation of membrane protease activity